MPEFPFYRQLESRDCGPSCVRMIAKYYGRTYSVQMLRERASYSREGVSLLDISTIAESIGMRTLGVRISFKTMLEEVPLPCIAHWEGKHFIVVYRIKASKILVGDPAFGLITYDADDFKKRWLITRTNSDDNGYCLILEPTPDFFAQDGERVDSLSLSYYLKYFRPYQKYIVQIFLGMLCVSILQLVFPFLTQAIVDQGINNQNLEFVYLILIGQLVLYLSQASIEFIRSWMLMHMNTRIGISVISDFLSKMMKLPLSFFDQRAIGDILVRISDHSRVQAFLSASTLSILFSIMNMLVFGVVLAAYNSTVLLIFVANSILYVLFIYLFMKKRRELDFKRFSQSSNNQSTVIHLIGGMQEIKLANSEKQKRWEWEKIQAKIFKTSLQSLSLSQYQQAGAMFINQTGQILISGLAASEVIKGNLTFGMMLSIQYILGQLRNPVEQLIQFVRLYQDAKMSLERLGEIHMTEDEQSDLQLIDHRPTAQSNLYISNLSFRYGGKTAPRILEKLSFEIPAKGVTAIVGVSGSGKTTLVKLLLGFYQPEEGSIVLGDINFRNIDMRAWRRKCGVVMQDGYIFPDSIINNITLGCDTIDKQRLMYSARIANIKEFIESLPQGYSTKIGPDGQNLSQGQKQRLLIARAAYKNPDFIFFDEATNALDAENERTIMHNLREFLSGKTAVLVAHRLSTVVNADQIIVLARGKISETGSHDELIRHKGFYYDLVRDQLELGN